MFPFFFKDYGSTVNKNVKPCLFFSSSKFRSLISAIFLLWSKGTPCSFSYGVLSYSWKAWPILEPNFLTSLPIELIIKKNKSSVTSTTLLFYKYQLSTVRSQLIFTLFYFLVYYYFIINKERIIWKLSVKELKFLSLLLTLVLVTTWLRLFEMIICIYTTILLLSVAKPHLTSITTNQSIV